MNMPEALRKLALPLLVAFAVLYLFGMRSWVATGALLVISLAVLYLGVSSTLQGARQAQDARDTGERAFRYAGRDFRVFVDDKDEVWLRAADVKRFVAHGQSDAVLAQRYPSGFGRVHPQLDACYLHHTALRDLLVNSNANNSKINNIEAVQRFLLWVQKDVLGMVRFERGMAKAASPATALSTRQRRPAAKSRRMVRAHWFVRHWRGEVGLMAAVFGGALLVGSASWAVHLLRGPVDITLHYRWSALIHVAQLAVVSGGMYWWGRGVLHSTQRWVAAERSLLVALFATVIGFGGVLYGLSTMIDTEKQYFLTDFATIMLDADNKPKVQFDAKSNRILLDGELGFGSTNRVRALLAGHSQVSGIELKSYGGRAAEGFALMELIVENNLQTYVKAECMSACVYAYVGGWPRHVASTAQFGLHRSGYAWQAAGKERNSSDEAFAANLRSVGVDEAFIHRGLEPSIHGMYEPTAQEVLAARLGTAEWK